MSLGPEQRHERQIERGWRSLALNGTMRKRKRERPSCKGIMFCFFVLGPVATRQRLQLTGWFIPEIIETKERRQPGFSPIVWTRQQTAQPVNRLFHRHNHSFAVPVPPECHFLEEEMSWHHEMRRRFLDVDLLTNLNASGISVYSLPDGAGLNDLFRPLDVALYDSFVNKKIRLISWQSDRELHRFVVPNMINWTMPAQFQNLTFSQGTSDAGRIALRSPASYGMIGYTCDAMSHAWHALFRPSPVLQGELDQLTRELGLVPGRYHASAASGTPGSRSSQPRRSRRRQLHRNTTQSGHIYCNACHSLRCSVIRGRRRDYATHLFLFRRGTIGGFGRSTRGAPGCSGRGAPQRFRRFSSGSAPKYRAHCSHRGHEKSSIGVVPDDLRRSVPRHQRPMCAPRGWKLCVLERPDIWNELHRPARGSASCNASKVGHGRTTKHGAV